ncbi:hypothetical protein NP439_02320 [Oceanobacillus jeddahense]|uniref:DUF2178 domain-containing protein n=1 Tax=Oceanobacillus jeddahense TaxID=1462527 RepID=A0ABY5JVS8_9BACI|nr:hypothetical protein [Oceanobacillus jeddahense]UUI03552.1 hypothetical protein NP439_02320 [Oceanobacillus jeddahense]
MKTRKIGTMIFGTAALVVIGYTIYQLLTGKTVGFNEIIAISLALMMFFSVVTWGNRKEKDGIYQDEELGQKITEKSSKISYFILLFIILAAVAVDQLVNGTINIFLLASLGLGIIVLPIVEYVVAKKYQ